MWSSWIQSMAPHRSSSHMLVFLWWSHALDCIALSITHIVDLLGEGVRGDRIGPILKDNESYSLHRVAQRIKLETSCLGSKHFALELSLGFPSQAFLSFNFWEVTVQTPDGNGILSIYPDGKGQRVELSMAWASSCGKRILVKSWTCGIGKVGLLFKSNHGCSELPDGSSTTSWGRANNVAPDTQNPFTPLPEEESSLYPCSSKNTGVLCNKRA